MKAQASFHRNYIQVFFFFGVLNFAFLFSLLFFCLGHPCRRRSCDFDPRVNKDTELNFTTQMALQLASVRSKGEHGEHCHLSLFCSHPFCRCESP